MGSTTDSPCNTSLIAFGYGNRDLLSSSIKGLMLATSVVTLLALVVCTAVFVHNRPYYDRLKVRQTFLVFMTVMGVTAQVVAGPLASISDVAFDSFPCWVRLVIMVLVPVLLGSSVLLRMMIFHFMSNLTRMAVRRHKELIETEGKRMGPSRRGLYAIRIGFTSFFVRVEDSKSALIALRFLISTPGQIAVAVVIGVPYMVLVLVVALVVPEYRHGCTGCKLFPNVFIVFAIAAIGFMFSGLLLFLKIRHEDDYWGLGREVGLTFATLVVATIGFLMSFLVSNNFQALQTFGFLLFIVPQTLYPVWVARNVEGKRKLRKNKAAVNNHNDQALAPVSSMGAGTSQMGNNPGGVTVKMVMQNAELFKAFEAHITKELAVESLLFLKDANTWKDTYDKSPQRDATARKIFETYVKHGAVLEINISSKMRNDLENLLDHTTELSKNAFDATIKDITFLVQTGPLARFAHTAECATALSKIGNHTPQVEPVHVSEAEDVT
jgi:hypothetical protein